jgi:hypothetical protein
VETISSVGVCRSGTSPRAAVPRIRLPATYIPGVFPTRLIRVALKLSVLILWGAQAERMSMTATNGVREAARVERRLPVAAVTTDGHSWSWTELFETFSPATRASEYNYRKGGETA